MSRPSYRRFQLLFPVIRRRKRLLLFGEQNLEGRGRLLLFMEKRESAGHDAIEERNVLLRIEWR